MLKFAHALFLILGYCIKNVSSLNDEGMALLSFKKSIEKDPRAAFVNWNPSDSTPCSWQGVKCENQTVISISIPLKNLSGPLPAASLGSLSNLKHLNVRSNGFSGQLSPEIFRAQKLRSLVLSRNSFSGILPSEIGNLKNLENLVLSENYFSGPLELSLFSCKKLRRLLLSHNNFSGALPHGLWRNFPLLERLELSYNSFNGSIPSDLGSLSNLKRTLDLSHNQFTGLIPSSLGKLSSEAYVDLSYNNLRGPIPTNVSDLMYQKPITFVGNPKLCGFPLANPCSSPPLSPSPSPSPAEEPKSSVNLGRLIGSAVIDINFLFIVSFLCLYCTRTCCKMSKRATMEEFACFERDTSSSENSVQYGLVCFDSELNLDAEKLFRSSASVFSSSGMGILYKVELENGLKLAVKRLKGGGLIRVEEQFDAEMEAISKIKHNNILSIRAYYLSITEFLLISDFISNGNLATAIRGTYSPLPWHVRLKIMKGVAQGLTYLHEKQHVHGDLKPSNILLGNGMEPKISDFGVRSLAKHVNRFQGSDSFIPSSYRAPEVIGGSKASRKSDVFSFGVIFLEMIRGRRFLFGEMQKKCTKDDDKKPEVDPFLLQTTEEIDGIVTVFKIAISCTADDPEMRPSMKLVANSLTLNQAPQRSFFS